MQVWVTELDVKMQNNCSLDNQAAVFDAILAACIAITPQCVLLLVVSIAVTYCRLDYILIQYCTAASVALNSRLAVILSALAASLRFLLVIH